MTEEQKRERLAAAAIAVFGEQWVYRLARDMGVTVRSAQRWASGERGVPDDVLAEIEAKAAEAPTWGLRHDIESAITKALDAGVPVQAVAGALRDAAADLVALSELSPGKP